MTDEERERQGRERRVPGTRTNLDNHRRTAAEVRQAIDQLLEELRKCRQAPKSDTPS